VVSITQLHVTGGPISTASLPFHSQKQSQVLNRKGSFQNQYNNLESSHLEFNFIHELSPLWLLQPILKVNLSSEWWGPIKWVT
jgi:hypothetical protein